MLRSLQILIILVITSFCGHGQGIYSVERIKSNSGSGDFAPVFVNDSIVFCSRRAERKAKNTLTNLYSSRIHENGDLKDQRLLTGIFLSENHDGPISYASGTQTIAFSRNLEDTTDSRRKVLPVGIFIASYENGQWTEPIPFPYNSLDFSNAHPALSPDGKMLVYSSTQPGGYGASDLYVSWYLNGEWTTPDNLGPEVNTEGSELFPSWQSNGRLYFSTDGRKGFGGLDIWYTRFDDSWVSPKLLDEPVNSSGDDFGITADKFHVTGYFSSSRNGIDEIFRFHYQKPVIASCDTMKTEEKCVTFFENGPAELDTVPYIGYVWEFHDGTRIAGDTASFCFQGPGSYPVRLLVTDTLEGYKEALKAEYVHDIFPDLPSTIECSVDSLERSCTFSVLNLDEKTFPIREYYWEFSDGHVCVGKKAYYKVPDEDEPYVRLSVYARSADDSVETTYCVVRKLE